MPIISPDNKKRSSIKDPEDNPYGGVSLLDHNRSHSTAMKVSSISGSKLLTVERLNSARNSHAPKDSLSKGGFPLEQDPERQTPSDNKELSETQKPPFEVAKELEKLENAEQIPQ